MEETRLGCDLSNQSQRQFVDSTPICPRCGSECNKTNIEGKYYCCKCGYTLTYSENKIL